MSKRITDEERIVAFFETASVERADTVLNIVTGMVRRRNRIASGNGTRRQRQTKEVQREKTPDPTTLSAIAGGKA